MSAPTADLVTLGPALSAAAARLEAAGVPSPWYDAEALAAHVLGIERSRLALVTELPGGAYDALVRRRAAREPLQHLTGVAGFRRLDLAVGPGVFVPRPETEVLVDWCLDAMADQSAPLTADLCAGSGAIALSLASEHPGAVVHAVEREAAALAWLTRNVAALPPATAARVHVVADDVDGCLPLLDGRLDLVAANPPYIPSSSRPLDPEVRDHDPAAALYGGPDGLDVVRVVVAAAARLLRDGGVVAIEHADAQGDAVPALLQSAGGWTDVADHLDLTGRPRFATARRQR